MSLIEKVAFLFEDLIDFSIILFEKVSPYFFSSIFLSLIVFLMGLYSLIKSGKAEFKYIVGLLLSSLLFWFVLSTVFQDFLFA